MSSESFNTGAKRGSQVGKGRPDLISPWANQALAAVLEAGAAEYGDRNWEKGIPIMRHMASCKRHIDQFIMRLTEETKDGKVVPVNHLWNAYANLMMAIHTMAMIQGGVLPGELDDRPDYGKKAVGAVIGATQYVADSYGHTYFLVSECRNAYGALAFDIRRYDGRQWQYWWPCTPTGWIDDVPTDSCTWDWGALDDAEIPESFKDVHPNVQLNRVTLEEVTTYARSH